MKLLNVYKSMAKELFIEAEVDDDKIIKYKKEDGEQGEMKASSAKTMPKDHPAKIEYDKMTDGDSDSDTSKGQALSGGDFERPGTDTPSDEPDEKGDLDNAFDHKGGGKLRQLAFKKDGDQKDKLSKIADQLDNLKDKYYDENSMSRDRYENLVGRLKDEAKKVLSGDEKGDIDINTFDGVKKHADKVEKALDLLSNDMKKFEDGEPPYNDLSDSEWDETRNKLRDAESKLNAIIRDDPRDNDYEGNGKKGIQNKITKSYKKEVDNISSDAQEYIDKVKVDEPKGDDGSDKPESELEKLDKEIKSTEANMNMAASYYSDPRSQDEAAYLMDKLKKLRADREKLVGGSDKNETKVINGVHYKAIKESKEKTFAEKVKENSKRFAKRK